MNVIGSSTVMVAVFVALELAFAVAVRVTLREADKPDGAVKVTELVVTFDSAPQPLDPAPVTPVQFEPEMVQVTP